MANKKGSTHAILKYNRFQSASVSRVRPQIWQGHVFAHLQGPWLRYGHCITNTSGVWWSNLHLRLFAQRNLIIIIINTTFQRVSFEEKYLHLFVPGPQNCL